MKYDPHSIFTRGEAIPRLHRPDPAVFEAEFARRHKPVILTGVTESWPCVKKWTTAYLRETGGHRPVNPSRAQAGIHFDEIPGTSPPPIPLGDYLAQIERGELGEGQLYAGNISVKNAVPEIWGDVELPPYYPPDDQMPPSLWIGPGGNVVPIHHDDTHNLFSQIVGRKTVLLFPPEDRKFLYPFPLNHRSFYFSQTNVAHPDLARFPKMRRARCSVVNLEQGEILFMPRFWWHAVFGYEFNISLSFWWRPDTGFRWGTPWHEAGFRNREFNRFKRNLRKTLTAPFRGAGK